MSELPTQRQAEVLQTIVAFQRDRGYSPTTRDLCLILGIRSTNGVADHLKALERKGYVIRSPMRARTLIPSAVGWKFIASMGSMEVAS
jgi:repressor LexA